jgi:Rieske Fe-S protein
MFLGVDDHRSVRTAPIGEGRRLLIVTGETYEPGTPGVEERFAELTGWLTGRFPSAEQPMFRWSAQDYTSADGVPFVGKLPGHDRVWVATGFGGWGMTNAMMAAALLTSRITGDVEPAWSGLYDPRRLHPVKEAGNLAKNALTVAKNVVAARVGPADATLDSLAPGQGAVVSLDGHRTAAYRDDDGGLHLVSATCTHLGCIVGFNDAEHTWDCPCHGSRFDVDGNILQGPALSPLKKSDRGG